MTRSDLLDAARSLSEDTKLKKAAAAVVLLGLAAYAAAGWKGLAVLAVALLLGAWSARLRKRALRWYLLG